MLPSGKFKTLQSKCRATIGVLSGGGRKDKPFLKAGKKYHSYRTRGKQYPIVRGVAMNPIDHPHGGGEGKSSGGRHPVSPCGVPTKGYKTRNKKKISTSLIIRRRNK